MRRPKHKYGDTLIPDLAKQCVETNSGDMLIPDCDLKYYLGDKTAQRPKHKYQIVNSGDTLIPDCDLKYCYIAIQREDQNTNVEL